MAIGHWNSSVTDLIPAYKHTKRMLECAREQTTDESDKQTLGSMISDCEYTIDWLMRGRRPGSVRGVERPMRISCWNPEWIDRYNSPGSRYAVVRDQTSRDLTDEERFRIEEAMRDLSMREKQCYMMHHVDGMSYEDIAREIYVGKSTVQKYIERANEKIENAKLTSLFLLG